MTGAGLIAAAVKQQELTGRDDADVSFVIPGKWPAKGNHKRLAGRRGPLGPCVAEYEDSVLCLFKANEVIAFVRQLKGDE